MPLRSQAVIVVVCAFAAAPRFAEAAEPMVRFNFESVATSNLYGDSSREWDLILRPAVELGLDFSDYWSVGYSGEVNGFSQHTDLLSHWHEAYLFANPAWGADGQNEYTFEVRLQYLGNREAFQAIDFLRPSVFNKLILEPTPWLRWRAELEGSYRDFYNDPDSRSFDIKAFSALTFALPTRTSLTARVSSVFRFYENPIEASSSAPPDGSDQQLELGVHVAQALWRQAGMQLLVGYLPAISNNALLEAKMNEAAQNNQASFFYFGDEILYSGHRAKAILKQKVGDRLELEASFAYEQRDFTGWMLTDEQTGEMTNESRRDLRLVPRGLIRYAHRPTSGIAGLDEAGLTLEYTYIRQQSNDRTLDTDTHLLVFSCWGSW
jgi:hypothetical protein